MKKAERRSQFVYWLAFGGFGVWFCWHLIPNLAMRLRFEDQLIVLRYARNFAEGNGLVYNVGEHVMGFTTPLFTVLSAVFVVLGGEQAPAWQNTFGIGCLLGTAAVGARLIARLGAGLAAPLLVALVTFNPARAFNYLFVGMEVHLFALLFLLAVDLHLSERHTAANIVAALLFLTRPEGLLLALMLLGDQWWRERKPPVRQAVVSLATVVPWLIFATLYYGSPLTATLAAKRGELLAVTFIYLGRVADVYRESASSLLAVFAERGSTGFVVGTLLLLATLPVGTVTLVRCNPRAWPLIAYPLAATAGYASIGAWPDFTWHYYPVGVLAAILIAVGCHRIAQRCFLGSNGEENELRGERLRRAGMAFVLLAAAAPVLLNTRGQIHYRLETGLRQQELETLGHELAARYDTSTTVLVDEIGHIGWISRLQIIDQAGLVTPGLRYDVTRREAVEQHRPDLMLLHVDALVRHHVRLGEGFPFGYKLIRDFNVVPEYRLYQRPGLRPRATRARPRAP